MLNQTFSHLKNSRKTTVRLIYQNQFDSPSVNAAQKVDSSDENLRRIADTAKVSVEARLDIMKGVSEKISPIATERQQYLTAVDQAVHQLNNNPGQTVSVEFHCLDKVIQIVMSPDGVYEEFCDNQPINFLTWIQEQK